MRIFIMLVCAQQVGRGRDGRDVQEWELAGDTPDLRPCPLVKVRLGRLQSCAPEALSHGVRAYRVLQEIWCEWESSTAPNVPL